MVVVAQVPPAGSVYLPDCSYREMTEWALPAQRLVEFEQIAKRKQHDPDWQSLRPYVRGGQKQGAGGRGRARGHCDVASGARPRP